MQIIKLESKDGDIFTVDSTVIKCSGRIQKILNNLGNKKDDMDPIPFLNVDTPILKMVISWAEHHKDDPVQENLDLLNEGTQGRSGVEDVSCWDKAFLDVELGTLFRLIVAAKYLDIKALQDVTCTVVASKMKNKKPEQIRKLFNIPDDLSAEQKEAIRKENKILEENRKCTIKIV